VAIIAAPAVIVVAVAVALILSSGSGSGNGPAPSGLPGLRTTSPPWPVEPAHQGERLDALGLTRRITSEAFHHHDLLQLYDHRSLISVPASIGLDGTAGIAAPLHTHDSVGIIHIEDATERTFTLGQFFGVWGVRFSATCMGGLCNSGQNQLRVFVDGKPYEGDPSAMPLGQHQYIVITYGTQAELPKPIPDRYSQSVATSCAPSC
jgi:hypothetical protein